MKKQYIIEATIFAAISILYPNLLGFLELPFIIVAPIFCVVPISVWSFSHIYKNELGKKKLFSWWLVTMIESVLSVIWITGLLFFHPSADGEIAFLIIGFFIIIIPTAVLLLICNVFVKVYYSKKAKKAEKPGDASLS